MAHSRLEKIGTIYTRITGIIRAGAMKLEDRPVWYEVYQAFPPADPPRYDRPAPNIPLREIFYEEDVVRAKFHKKVGNGLAAVDLSDGSNPTATQRVLAEWRRLRSEEGLGDAEASELAVASPGRTTQLPPPLPSDPPAERPPQDKVLIKDIFKDS